MNQELVNKCKLLLEAYKSGKLGQTKMPEDSHPNFTQEEAEQRIAYFTLPMALNYQRDSYKLWESALKTYQDEETKPVFNVKLVSEMPEDKLRTLLMKHKLALQPNKHIATWQTISKTIAKNFNNFTGLINSTDSDFLKLKEIIQTKYKKGFPYLSGPKIFNYWAFILGSYAGVSLSNKQFIEIAPDTHITKCSVLLGVITESEASSLTKDEISARWRTQLDGSSISPIDMHPPLWFWSRNGFLFKL